MKMTFLMIFSSLFISCSTNKESFVSTRSAKAEISGKAVGEVTFNPSIGGIVMKVRVVGLKPNTNHGFHIHEYGVCEKPDYKTAGSHFNPGKQLHAGPENAHKHLGDLGNLISNSQGVAEKELLMNDLKDAAIINNKSIIIHENVDDLRTQPSGNSGNRIACGIIHLK